MKNTRVRMVVLSALVVVAAALYACATTATMAKSHPVEVGKSPRCTACHSDERAAFDHTDDFGKFRHRFYAQQRPQMCALCHKDSFCADCHAHKEEIKPSDKFKDNPEGAFPHPGDYINKHKIDGRINPAPCMKCHGRSNNARCKACHR